MVIGAVAAALTLFTDSGESDRALPGPSPTAPATGVAPVGPTPSGSSGPGTPSASASRSAPTASRTASPSGTPSSSPKPASPSAGAGKSQNPAPPDQPVASPQAQTLRKGDSGPEVRDLQQRLKQRGYFRGRSDGQYDDYTEWMVASFQEDNDITQDPPGVYGPATRKALEQATDWG
ncbi:peptidoglycan-binding domain-containing protein [Streptomyces antimicrobicus]|uniref:Peptidoglycan-binding protein n=1 Tax=Streptomyces antimicrobicus TaxID=2883108 RepID=A0ABS8B8R7_9ACTN|nr:peptidoglycan-binding domain-containing protein [Streptomyces antimicrobicus]MCB5180997.1 peptidoglycan-binding protein [Streptomyces antimicrobicus]